jgi:hypothetical protein
MIDGDFIVGVLVIAILGSLAIALFALVVFLFIPLSSIISRKEKTSSNARFSTNKFIYASLYSATFFIVISFLRLENTFLYEWLEIDLSPRGMALSIALINLAIAGLLLIKKFRAQLISISEVSVWVPIPIICLFAYTLSYTSFFDMDYSRERLDRYLKNNDVNGLKAYVKNCSACTPKRLGEFMDTISIDQMHDMSDKLKFVRVLLENKAIPISSKGWAIVFDSNDTELVLRMMYNLEAVDSPKDLFPYYAYGDYLDALIDRSSLQEILSLIQHGLGFDSPDWAKHLDSILFKSIKIHNPEKLQLEKNFYANSRWETYELLLTARLPKGYPDPNWDAVVKTIKMNSLEPLQGVTFTKNDWLRKISGNEIPLLGLALIYTNDFSLRDKIVQLSGISHIELVNEMPLRYRCYLGGYVDKKLLLNSLASIDGYEYLKGPCISTINFLSEHYRQDTNK